MKHDETFFYQFLQLELFLSHEVANVIDLSQYTYAEMTFVSEKFHYLQHFKNYVLSFNIQVIFYPGNA